MARHFNCDDSTITSIANNSIYDKIEYSNAALDKLILEVGLSDDNLKENYKKHNERKLAKD